ncbi:MAG: aldo/keto reductase [Thermomicrobiales bacterium]
MRYRRLGRTNLDVSVLGLGSGGPSQLGQKSGVAEADVRHLVWRARDLGVNLIDTAADYGKSEAILGRALQGLARNDYVLCTKFSPARRAQTADGHQLLFRTEHDLIASCERSLVRLQTDYIDVLQFHGVIPETYPHVRDTLYPAVQRIQEQGKVRFIGLTESFAADDSWQALLLALADDLFDTLLVGYNLLTPGPEDDVFPKAQRQDVGIMIMCAVRRKIAQSADLEGLMMDLKRRGEVPASVPAEAPLDWLLHGDVHSVTDAAYKFALGHPAVSSVLTGTASLQHLEANVAAILGDRLPEEDRERLTSLFGPIGRKLGD